MYTKLYEAPILESERKGKERKAKQSDSSASFTRRERKFLGTVFTVLLFYCFTVLLFYCFMLFDVNLIYTVYCTVDIRYMLAVLLHSITPLVRSVSTLLGRRTRDTTTSIHRRSLPPLSIRFFCKRLLGWGSWAAVIRSAKRETP